MKNGRKGRKMEGENVKNQKGTMNHLGESMASGPILFALQSMMTRIGDAGPSNTLAHAIPAPTIQGSMIEVASAQQEESLAQPLQRWEKKVVEGSKAEDYGKRPVVEFIDDRNLIALYNKDLEPEPFVDF